MSAVLFTELAAGRHRHRSYPVARWVTADSRDDGESIRCQRRPHTTRTGGTWWQDCQTPNDRWTSALPARAAATFLQFTQKEQKQSSETHRWRKSRHLQFKCMYSMYVQFVHAAVSSCRVVGPSLAYIWLQNSFSAHLFQLQPDSFSSHLSTVDHSTCSSPRAPCLYFI